MPWEQPSSRLRTTEYATRNTQQPSHLRVGDVAPGEQSGGPVERDADPAAHTHDLRQVEDTPDEPCRQAAERYRADGGRRVATPEGDHLARRTEDEGLEWVAGQEPHQVAAHGCPFPDGDGGVRRQRGAAILVRYEGVVAKCEDVGRARDAQVLVDDDPAVAALLNGQRRGDRIGPDACRPDERRGGDL